MQYREGVAQLPECANDIGLQVENWEMRLLVLQISCPQFSSLVAYFGVKKRHKHIFNAHTEAVISFEQLFLIFYEAFVNQNCRMWPRESHSHFGL